MRLALLLAGALAPAASFAAEPDAAALFEKNCKLCHQAGSATRAPLPESLRMMTPARILASLESGSMKAQGDSLAAEERQSLAKYLGAGAAAVLPGGTGNANACPQPMPAFAKLTGWNGWSSDEANARFSTSSGLKAGDVPKLKVKWAFGFPGAGVAIGQPAIVDGRLFVGSDKGVIYALDAKTGCQYWTFAAEATVRSAITIGKRKDNRVAAYFGDVKANAYSIDAMTGALIWKKKLDNHAMARVTGSPKLHEGRLYVPMASVEEVGPGNPKYPCCTFRGSLSSLDAETGEVKWKSYTIPDEPKPTKMNSAGVQNYGPAGAAVWLTPTIDAKRRLAYVGTGNDYAQATPYSDAVIAFSLDTGERKWIKQLHQGDAWNFGCGAPGKVNCPAEDGPDFDIGASPVLRKWLIVGQKSGMVHALDPDSDGKVIWQTRIGQGGKLGGVQWGLAADQEMAYVALSDIENGMDRSKPLPPPGGVFALDLKTGAKVWATLPPKPACAGERGCSAAQMSAVAVIPGIAFAGGMDGTLRAYETKTGKIVWEVDTRPAVTTVNGVAAKGGSISGGGPVVTGGMVFVNSGYGALGGMPGNLLLAFGL